MCVLHSSSLNIIIQRYLAKEAEILTGLRREEQAKIKQKEREEREAEKAEAKELRKAKEAAAKQKWEDFEAKQRKEREKALAKKLREEARLAKRQEEIRLEEEKQRMVEEKRQRRYAERMARTHGWALPDEYKSMAQDKNGPGAIPIVITALHPDATIDLETGMILGIDPFRGRGPLPGQTVLFRIVVVAGVSGYPETIIAVVPIVVTSLNPHDPGGAP